MPGLSLPTTGILGGSLGIGTDGLLGGGFAAITVDSWEPAIIPDDGGVKVTATGTFPTGTAMQVRIYNLAESISKFAYSGVVEQGLSVFSANGTQITFISPPLLGRRGYRVEITPSVGPVFDSGVDVLESIHRSFTTNLYSIRSPQANPRDVGPRSLRDEPTKSEDI
jgi:hypothetical protein